MKRFATIALGLALMVIGLLLMTGGVSLLALAPRWYQATVRVAVEKPSAVATNPPPAPAAERGRGHWVQTDSERMRSKLVLFPVITNLHLNQTWAEKLGRKEPLETGEAYRMLKERMEVRETRATSLIEISIRSPDPAEAARIANAIPESFRAVIVNGGRIEVVETAAVPVQSVRQKQSLAVILFLGGALLMVVGYVSLRPHLANVASAPVLRP